MNKFKETQYFSPVIKWILTAFISGLMLISILLIVTNNETKEALWTIIITLIICFSVLGLFWISRLQLEINKKGIKYQLTPLEFREKNIEIADIAQLSIRKLKWFEFGGLGKRRKFFKKKLGYIMNRNFALEVNLKNGKTIVFSIENEKRLKKYLNNNLAHLLKPSNNH